jgi:hypothetical protein
MRKNIKCVVVTFVSLLLLIVLNGCRVYSWMVLENPEFKNDMLPTELEATVLEKYQVGDVTVKPCIEWADGAQKKLKLLIMFYSTTKTSVVSVSSVSLSVDGAELDYGRQISNESMIDWEMYPANNPFYVSGISGEAFDYSKDEIKNVQINLVLDVSVEGERGIITDKKIKAYFIPKKQSYIEGKYWGRL